MGKHVFSFTIGLMTLGLLITLN